jgi:hypothetical protein
MKKRFFTVFAGSKILRAQDSARSRSCLHSNTKFRVLVSAHFDRQNSIHFGDDAHLERGHLKAIHSSDCTLMIKRNLVKCLN